MPIVFPGTGPLRTAVKGDSVWEGNVLTEIWLAFEACMDGQTELGIEIMRNMITYGLDVAGSSGKDRHDARVIAAIMSIVKEYLVYSGYEEGDVVSALTEIAGEEQT